MKKFFYLFLLFLLLGCRNSLRIRLATTTSVENSGILKLLLKEFKRDKGIKVDVIAVGTGAALRLGRNGDCDIIIVHSKEDEEKFIKEGFGVKRREIMWNDFVILGPSNDPAGIKGKGIFEGIKDIREKQAIFVSRADASGTDKKEKALWKKAEIEPKGKWYQKTGQGMGETLIIANEKGGYCLSDRGTFISYKDKISLVILKEDPKLLYNPYSVILINPKRYPTKYKSAIKLSNWLVSPKAQNIIKEFKINGIRLFNPILVDK